jgi:hypothetical protein
MNQLNRISRRSPHLWLLCCLVGSPLYGQLIIGNSPAVQVPNGYDPLKAASKSGIESAFTKLPALSLGGPLGMRPHFNYSVIYGDGLLTVPGEPTNSTMQSVSAGTQFELGRQWFADYTHTKTFYSSRLLTNTSNDSASLSTGRSYENWTWGFSQSYSTSSQILAETGRQTNQENWVSALQASYVLGDRTNLSASVQRGVRDAAPTVAATSLWTGSDWVQWSGSVGLQYALTSRINVGVSMRGGYDQIDGGNDMNYSEPNVSMSWRPTDKISLSINRGVERREIKEGGANQTIKNPVYSGSLTYQPFETTTFTGSATRNVSASYFNNEIVRNIQWSTSIQQRLLQHYYVNGSYSQGKTAYIPTSRTISPIARDDDFNSYGVQVSRKVFRRGSISLSYDISENSSSDREFGFKSHQIGGNFAYRF